MDGLAIPPIKQARLDLRSFLKIEQEDARFLVSVLRSVDAIKATYGGVGQFPGVERRNGEPHPGAVPVLLDMRWCVLIGLNKNDQGASGKVLASGLHTGLGREGDDRFP